MSYLSLRRLPRHRLSVTPSSFYYKEKNDKTPPSHRFSNGLISRHISIEVKEKTIKKLIFFDWYSSDATANKIIWIQVWVLHRRIISFLVLLFGLISEGNYDSICDSLEGKLLGKFCFQFASFFSCFQNERRWEKK